MTKFDSRRCILRLVQLESRITPVAGYFRVATYNIASISSPGDPRPGLDTILAGIGAEPLPAPLNGGPTPPNQVIEPLDVIALQEVRTQATTSQAVVNLMNTIYGAGVYGRGTLNGTASGGALDTVGAVYNTQKLQLYPIDLVTPANSGELAIGISGTDPLQPRQAMRYKFHPIGYPTSADFYVYVSHAKAGTASADEDRREVEADAIRANADTLGNANIIYAGDFNVQSSSDAFMTAMYGAGVGQAFDPINRPGTWNNNVNAVDIITQAPANSPPGGLTGGGLDDRFDFQIFTNELTDGFGFEYVPSTYHTFGINGSLSINSDINDVTLPNANTALPVAIFPNRIDILNKLTTVTDHLPVVADYRFELPPTAAVTINDASAQRSRITELTVTFSRPVTYPFGINSAFQLNRQGDNATVTLNATSLNSTTAKISFNGGAVDFNSLADGRYNFTIVSTSVSSSAGTLDGNSDMIPGGNYTLNSAVGPAAPTNIFRLYGDSDGTNSVDQTDFIAFRNAFGAGPSVTFDFNNNTNVDQPDFIEFRNRFGTSV